MTTAMIVTEAVIRIALLFGGCALAGGYVAQGMVRR